MDDKSDEIIDEIAKHTVREIGHTKQMRKMLFQKQVMPKHFRLFKKFGSLRNNTKTVTVSGFHGLIVTNESCELGDFRDQIRLALKPFSNRALIMGSLHGAGDASVLRVLIGMLVGWCYKCWVGFWFGGGECWWGCGGDFAC